MNVEASRRSSIFAIMSAAASPVVMSMGRLGLVVGLSMLLGAMCTLALVFALRR